METGRWVVQKVSEGRQGNVGDEDQEVSWDLVEKRHQANGLIFILKALGATGGSKAREDRGQICGRMH